MKQELTPEQVWNNLQGAAIRGEITDKEVVINYTMWLDEKGIPYEVKDGKVCISQEETHNNEDYARLLEIYAKDIRGFETLPEEVKQLIGTLGKSIFKYLNN